MNTFYSLLILILVIFPFRLEEFETFSYVDENSESSDEGDLIIIDFEYANRYSETEIIYSDPVEFDE